MANRRSLALRRNDASVPLRPPEGHPNQWDAALRSDFSYIPEDLDPPKAILHVRDLTHTSVEVAFDPLQMPVDVNFGAPIEIILVRSPSGFPSTLLDGIMVRRHPPLPPDNEGWVRTPDTGLTPGTWYYYGLFAKYFDEGNTYWLRVGERSVLLPQEYLSADHLWERIPEWYRRSDMVPGGQPGVLRRLIDVIGYQTDAHRTWAHTVGDVWDAEKISADLLPFLGDTLGQPVEYAAGDERYRALLSNILPLRKIKGTEHGTEAYISALTGYRTRVYSGLNLLPTINEAEAMYSSGLWQMSGGNATLTRVVSTGVPAGGPAAGATFHRMTYNTTASQQPKMQLGIGGNMTHLIPFEGGHQIIVSLFYRSSFTGTLVVWFDWYDARGTFLGPTVQSTIGPIDTTWKRDSSPPVTAPTAAAFVGVSFGLSAATNINGLVVEMTEILVADLAWRPEDVPGSANTPPLSGNNPGEYDDVGYYEPPRTVHVNVYPQRINYALNSDFRMDNVPPYAWSVADRATWGLLKAAYDSWGDVHDEQVGDSEVDWADLAEGFESLGGDWSITFDTAFNRLMLNPDGNTVWDYANPGYLTPATGTVSTPDIPQDPAGGVRYTADPEDAVIYNRVVGPSRIVGVDPAGTPYSGRIYSMQMESINRARLVFPGIYGNYLSVPHAANFNVTDIEVVIRTALTDWTPTTNQTWVCRVGDFGLGGIANSWAVAAAPGGLIAFMMTDNPNNAMTSVPSSAVPFADGAMGWVKVTRVAATGLVSFYTTADSAVEPTTWTARGTATIYAGVAPPTITSPLLIGQRRTVDPFAGRIARVIVRNGVAGTTLVDISENNAGTMATPTTFVATSGQTVTVESSGTLPHLIASIGVFTTPDPGPLPNECTFVFRVRGPVGSGGSYNSIADQSANHVSDRAWNLSRIPNSSSVILTEYPAGTSAGQISANTTPQVKTGDIEHLALSVVHNNGTNWVVQSWLNDGTWHLAGSQPPIRAPAAPRDSSLPLCIGAGSVGGPGYNDRIYSVELRTGLNPAGGSVIWRFDASEYPGSGLSYVDPRGRTWTMSTAGTIIPGTAPPVVQPQADTLLWRFLGSEYPVASGTTYVDPRGRTWTMSTAGAVTAMPSVTSNYAAQVQSHFVPVVAGESISAAFVVWATVPDVQFLLSVQFFTDEGAQYILSIDGVNQDVHGVAQILTTEPYRYELRNAVIPEGAAFARVVVETFHATEPHKVYLQQALIENAQIPGAYFNGDDVDSAFGDYFFTGLPHESYSVYYQNYRSFINDVGGSDRITTLMDELLPMETDFVLRTAAYGLY